MAKAEKIFFAKPTKIACGGGGGVIGVWVMYTFTDQGELKVKYFDFNGLCISVFKPPIKVISFTL
jgi:hypothetical protein